MDGPLGEDPVMLSYSKRLRQIARRTARSDRLSVRGQPRFDAGGHRVAPSRKFDPSGAARSEPLGEPLSIKGRIDRIDRWASETGIWLRVIDYKSGNASFEPSEVYFGLQMQLVIYLAAAMSGEGGRPAGAFYFHVDDPLVPTLSRTPDDVEREREKRMRLDGPVVADLSVIEAMSPEPERVMKVRLTKDGRLNKSAPALTEAQFMALARHALRAAARFAGEIRAGATDISPALSPKGKKLSCTYCPYPAICGIDARLPGGEPRALPPMKLNQMMDEIASESQGDE